MPRILFASMPLRLVLPTDRAAAAADGVKELVFRTLPSFNKIEIRRMLERLYSLPVESVDTVNYEGKKKRSRAGYFRKPDFKVAYVKLTEAVKIPYVPPPPADAAPAKKAA
jgi:large subunit ribosomal protein L23